MRLFSGLVISVGVWAGGGATLACSPPSGDPAVWAQEHETAYLANVTGIYRGIADDVVGDVDSGVTFTVRKTENIWGLAGADVLDLGHEPGSCSDYQVIWLEDFTGQPFQSGQRVRVFVTPQSEADPTLLFVLPEGLMAEGMMDRWRLLSTKAADR